MEVQTYKAEAGDPNKQTAKNKKTELKSTNQEKEKHQEKKSNKAEERYYINLKKIIITGERGDKDAEGKQE